MALVGTGREAFKSRYELAIERTFAATLCNRIPLLRPAPVQGNAVSPHRSPKCRTGNAVMLLDRRRNGLSPTLARDDRRDGQRMADRQRDTRRALVAAEPPLQRGIHERRNPVKHEASCSPCRSVRDRRSRHTYGYC